MPKIICGSIDCKWIDEDNVCCYGEDKPIRLNDCHIHTVNEGFKHFHICKAYEESEEARDIRIKLESDLRYVRNEVDKYSDL